MLKKLVFVGILLLFVAPILLAEDYKKKIPVEDAMKAFCGTWINDGGYGTEKDIWNLNGTFEWYYFKTYTEPSYTGTFKIEKAWLDSEGNIWFTVWRSFMGNSWTLCKISNAGTVLELSRYFVADNAPTKIDDDRYPYFKYIRKKNE